MSQRIPVLTQKQVMANFPKRPRDSHKGMFGTVAVIGGASGMVGAPLLAARAALRMGAGIVHVGFMADNAPVVDLVQPELMLHTAADLFHPLLTNSLSHAAPLSNSLDETTSHSTRLQTTAAKSLVIPQAGERTNEKGNFESLGEGANVKNIFNPDVLALGCGMGTAIAAQKILYEALKRDKALVLDADALNMLAGRSDLQDDLRARKAPSILTPHPGEAGRLLCCGTAEVQADRIAAVRHLAQKFACSVVLKGADSLIATRDGKLFINKNGNPGMSAAGLGDVLTGMIAAFIAQGMNADDALLLAVHLHGAAGDALAQQVATIGMTASEVTDWARWLLNRWQSE